EQLHSFGAITIVTTHYNDLKGFAYATEGIENASVEFDVKTLRPTYHLRIGEAGASNALRIAQRLGLPREITDRAEAFIDPDQVAFEDLMKQVEGSRRAMDRQQTQAQKARAEAERLQQEREEHIADLQRRRDRALEEGFSEALEIVREAEEEARSIIAKLQRQPKQSKVTEEGRQRLSEMRRKAEQRLEKVREDRKERERQQAEAEAARRAEEERELEPEVAEVHAGDRVHVQSLGRDAEVIRALDNGVVEVRVGNMTVETRIDDLAPAHEQISTEAQEIHRRMQTRKSMNLEEEIDVRGMTVDEAIGELSKWLDDAMLAGAGHVRIIHGKGTGALREGVHDYLRKHRHVSDFSLAEMRAGGSGATEVRL
ncbi:MAG: Smr/MutS family protein, partial [Armatimonadota bacterium]